MKSINELAENGIERDLRIHRIVGIERFLQLIHEKSLTLMAPEKWQDPYEKALQAHYELQGEKERVEKVFGLCWSLDGRSDALWQIYSPNKLGIKVSSTVSHLVRSFKTPQAGLDEVYLGQVIYLPESTNLKVPAPWPSKPLGLSESDFSRPIRTFANAIDEIVQYRPNELTQNYRKKARAFLVKRRAFQHEKEIRLLCFRDSALCDQMQTEREKENKVINIPVSLEHLIDQVELDPRMGDDVAEALIALIRPMLPHLTKANQFKKSSLYTIPRSKGLPH